MIIFPTNKEFIAIIDFEATCSNDNSVKRNEMEIIEFACILVDKDLNIVKEFSKFIKPVVHPVLTEFCTELTTIQQKDVDSADDFDIVLQEFKSEILDNYDVLFASWGAYDRNQLIRDCKYHHIEYPFDDHLDIKRWIPKYIGLKKPKGIGGMIRHLGLKFKGTPHRGIDDVRNIVHILNEVSSHLPSN